jgi:hypothetical protein
VVLKDYPLNDILENKITLSFLNGDIIRFKSISSPLKTVVKINGAVFYPGIYAINSTKTIKSLIEKAKLSPEAKSDQAFLFRKKLDQSVQVISVNLQEILTGKIADIPLELCRKVQNFSCRRCTESNRTNICLRKRIKYTRSYSTSRWPKNFSFYSSLRVSYKSILCQKNYLYPRHH